MLPLLAAALILAQPPTLTVSAPHTVIDHSCRIVIAPGTIIPDADSTGALQITADDITIEFAEGSTLAGAPTDADPDTLAGIGLRLNGHKNITVKNLRIRGYKIGLRATDCPGLTIDTADLSNNYHQHLKSTVQAEDGADWLYPHNNDHDEWTTNYGAAASIKSSDRITLRNIKVRDGQNGIILDRVNDSAIYDNDCSFLSGWGMALWRSSNNRICRNALDFCVRGYSHGVYNRGQDSAGLLMFEQCSRNIIAENSITHGGDGIFGFAGQEAIGQSPAPSQPFDYARRGNSDNLIIDNDLSYAPAHGLEMTFSAGNRIYRNRFVSNGICGIWGGYSNDTIIAQNTFEANGQMAYGLERGGINIEHGSGSLIVANTFKANACGVHFWWNANPGLLKLPGVAANERGVTGNIIADNSFTDDLVALQLRDDAKAANAPHVRATIFRGNTFTGVKRERDFGEGISILDTGSAEAPKVPQIEVPGSSHPVGARAALAGRENILMTEWGPWDHEREWLRVVTQTGSVHIFDVFHRAPGSSYYLGGSPMDLALTAEGDGWPTRLTIRGKGSGVHEYTILRNEQRPGAGPAHPGPSAFELKGTIVSTSWNLTIFPWEGPSGPNPPPDLEAWRAAASGPKAVRARADSLRFAFGSRGPSEMEVSPEVTAAKFAPDHFGIIARAGLVLPKGKWRITTISDDGIRVIADGKAVIENWTHHGATTDAAVIESTGSRPIDAVVEYFEIFGAAVLEVRIERAN